MHCSDYNCNIWGYYMYMSTYLKHRNESYKIVMQFFGSCRIVLIVREAYDIDIHVHFFLIHDFAIS